MGKVLNANRLIDILVKLGKQLQELDEQFDHLIESAHQYNAWFISKNVRQAILLIGNMLNREDLTHWFSLQKRKEVSIHEIKKVGLILAGNIPAVGFHDILCVLVSGHQALIKMSSQDQKLIPYMLQKLIEIEPAFEEQLVYIDRLKGFDAVIATGSNNTSRYFDYYFKRVPHIIRKNRNSIAVFTGDETAADLTQVGDDIFGYFGLGCRNVSKLYVPIGYDFKSFFEAIEQFKWVGNQSKYNNNYDYNKSIFLVNRDKHLDNGFLLVKPSESLQSPLATLYYEEHEDEKSLEKKLKPLNNQIQCIVTPIPLNLDIQQVHFGNSQKPKLWDYADGVDTMHFLSGIN